MTHLNGDAPDVHKLSTNGPFPFCWEGDAAPMMRFLAVAEAEEIVEATEAHELVTCLACRKAMLDA